ncbi:hypothetical protein M7I_6657 [Glarea lozoyensis 74030]|uniref:Uncharacterized protein n=1 Tax=Glarea lozoyensis (strain ATCC 74030 / MF5533) TaxID=1104152 RepID=H0EV63_GLAL7|nr:hypothetical protein M7I_6657 [Glarea lozoyensis 74030]
MALRRGPLSRPNVDSKPGGSATIPLEPIGPFAPSIQPKFLQPRGLSSLNRASVSGSFLSTQSHIVHVTTSPKFFEVCINIGNFAIEHHEVDISHVSSDSELFALIWDKYNSSRGIGLRRLFLRPRNVDFVMFSVSRGVKYGTGIHKKPDEFPPPTEIEKKRYHYLHPKIRMPVNVFLHYLHRARWNIFGEHAETTWLRRLPKKLNESILTQALPYDAANQNDQQEVPMTDPNLAFGWGVHIIDGPNHAVLGVLLAISIGVAFLVSGLIVGFAKTQEQGFGVGSFLLTIFASIMAAMYFQLQDQ